MARFNKIFSKDILIVILIATILNILRIFIFGSYSFVWLFWNLFLAIIPFVISSMMLIYDKENRLKKGQLIFWGFLWILFIPNAPYIVTDLIHIGVVRSVPVIYDAFLLFSMAWLGLYLGFYSVFHINQIILKRFSNKKTEIFIFLITLFMSFGIYLGRFLRFNSWDVFKEPFNILKSTHLTFIKTEDGTSYLYIALFTFFIYSFYKAFRSQKLPQ